MIKNILLFILMHTRCINVYGIFLQRSKAGQSNQVSHVPYLWSKTFGLHQKEIIGTLQ